MTATIVPLLERPDLAEQVAVWGFAEWGHLNPGETLAQRVIRIRGKMNTDRVPVAFVALGADGAKRLFQLVWAHDLGQGLHPSAIGSRTDLVTL